MANYDPLQELQSMHDASYASQQMTYPQHSVNAAIGAPRRRVIDPLLLEFATAWMDTDNDAKGIDTPTNPSQSYIIAAPPAPVEASTIIDLTDIPTGRNTAMDDAASVVSVESFAEDQQMQMPPPSTTTTMTIKSSFMETCWDIDTFMDAAVTMNE